MRSSWCWKSPTRQPCWRVPRRPAHNHVASIIAAESHAAQGSLCRVIGQTDAAVIEETAEGVPTLEHVVDGLGGIGVAGELGAFGTQEGFQIGDQRRDMFFAIGESDFGRLTVDDALMGEDGVDPLYGLKRDRRDDGRLFVPCLAGNIGQNEELPAAVGPTCRFGNRCQLAARFIKPIEPGISVGLEDAAIMGQVLLGMDARAVTREVVNRRGRIGATERGIVAHVRPQSGRYRLALGQEWHRRIVAVNALAPEHMCSDQHGNRRQQRRCAAHMVSECRQRQIDAFTGISLALAVQGLMGRIFDDGGNRMTPVYSRKGALRYRYYVSIPREEGASGSVARVPAARAEEAVISAVREQLHMPKLETTDDASQSSQQVLTTPQIMIENYVERVAISEQGLVITLKPGGRGTSTKNTITVPLYVRGRTAHRQIVPGKDQTGRHKTLRAERRVTLVTAIAKARQWVDEPTSGRVVDINKLADREGCSERNIRRALSLAFLAPDIVQAAIDGELPPDLVMTRISSDLPLSWSAQREALALA